MSAETILTTLDRGWLTITLNQPANRNALSDAMVADVSSVLTAVADDRDVRGITFRGAGKVFCAGGDLKGFQRELNEASLATINAVSRRAGGLFHQINEMPQVVVMLVHGAAIAGGLGMMCAGDIVAVTADTRFALTETQLGIVPAQIAPLVIQRAGQATARRLMLTGARFDAQQAQTFGLADFVVDDGDALNAIESQMQTDVRRCAPGAVAATKSLLRSLTGLQRTTLIDNAAEVFAERLASDEGREGIGAFIEKRAPRWHE
ncbi:MAG: enoyl-CoA hydratase-related protein [Pseudomonadota bacterium]|mgnify:CR=1 FL=1